MSRRGHTGGSLLLLLLLASAACGTGEPALSEGLPPPVPEDRWEPGALRSVEAAPAVGRTGPGEGAFEVTLRTPEATSGHTRRIGSADFPIALRVRTPELSQYPCTSCHIAGDLVVTEERVEDAHRNIRPVHPAETGATCGTCHAADDVELMVLFSGERIALDHAYRMCAQCHASTVDAWASGAHGKRLDAWQGRRVVMGCADCHDPHQPALETRIPFPGPLIPRTARGEL